MKTTRLLSNLRLLLALISLASGNEIAASDDVARIAVASNFTTTMAALKQQFESDSAFTLKVSSASTGTLYAQILNGAPFDLLLAADVLRPTLLEEAALTVPGHRHTYAVGRLVVWSRDPTLQSGDCEQALLMSAGGTVKARVAIANPDTAPYGLAARQALSSLGLWEALQSRLVFGENIAQTLHFAATGNARLGLIAAAQMAAEQLPAATCSWELPTDSYAPIEQQLVLMKRGAENPAAQAFLDYLHGEAARKTIVQHGYAVPPTGSAR